MRRMLPGLLGLLALGLAVLIAARSFLPEAVTVMATAADSTGYNMLELELPVTTETAGSALVAEMNAYYLARTPTAKNACTGLLAGMNLIVICAKSWRPSDEDVQIQPGLSRLWSEGVQLAAVYDTDWYQGTDGMEFAVLSGLMPTSVRDRTAFQWAGEQGIYLPYALARALTAQGYDCAAYVPDSTRASSYEVLGFSDVDTAADVTDALLKRTDDGLFFFYCRWENTDGEDALEALLRALEDTGRSDSTAVCLLTGSAEEGRARLFLWGAGLAGEASDLPCSELDVTPTLLNLFGAVYDSRFLSGRDVFAPVLGEEGSSAVAVVSLTGSAFSDWVTDAGTYSAAEEVFSQTTEGRFSERRETNAYVRRICRLVYDRYTFARRVMENNYFQLVPGL